MTPEPLRYVGCRGAEAVAAYATDWPRALPLRSFSVDLIEVVPGDAYGWPQPAEGWSTRLARTGIALVCLADEIDWLRGAILRAARNPESRRVEIEIARNFLGISGAPQHYVIFIIPRPADPPDVAEISWHKVVEICQIQRRLCSCPFQRLGNQSLINAQGTGMQQNIRRP